MGKVVIYVKLVKTITILIIVIKVLVVIKKKLNVLKIVRLIHLYSQI